MEYHIIGNPNTRSAFIFTSAHGFIDGYYTYNEAKGVADEAVKDGDITGYKIVAECSDERNHVL